MNTYLTEIEINNKVYCWPDFQANSWEEAERMNEEQYKDTFVVMGKLLYSIDVEWI